MTNSEHSLKLSLLSNTPIEVTNHEFLEKIFEISSAVSLDNCKPICVSFNRSPADASPADWTGRAWQKVNEPKNADFNSYFSISVFHPDENGKYRRRKSQFAAQFVIAFDDVVAEEKKGVNKAQIPWSRIRLLPSWVLETSKGNYQVGYILEEPITDIREADTLSKSIIRKGLSDPGASGPTTRLMRLPFASNTKSNPPFKCQMRVWAPEKRYSLKQFTEAYGLNLSEARNAKAPLSGETKTVQFANDRNSVWEPKPTSNIVTELLNTKGLYKSKISSGKHDISCPWKEEHTNQIDSGACYWEPDEQHPIGSFKCQHAHCQERNISDLLEFLGVDPEDAYMKDRIFVYPGETNRIVEALEKILAGTGLFYQRGGRVVFLYSQKGYVTLTEVNIHDLLIEMSRLTRWLRYDGRAKRSIATDPVPKYLTALLENQRHNFLPVIEGVARQPLIREDGTINTAQGYDPKTQFYCSYNSEKFRIIEKPTKDDAKRSLEQLRYLLSEVQFETLCDESAALCAMLTAAVRIQLTFAPMFLIKAHQPGTGKGVLTELISLFATPVKPSPLAFPKDSSECEKLLLAELLKAPAVLNFDNITGDLYPHKYLCSALTSETLTGRVLGESRTITVGTKVLFLANGNNVSVVGDMTRRTVPINLNSKEEHPATRVFKNPNLLKQVSANREAYVSYALTIIAAWILAGKPMTQCQNLNSFEQWSEWCRQPLLWLGVPDPANNIFKAMADDPDRVHTGRVFDGIRREFGVIAFSVRDISERINKNFDSSVLREPLEDIGCYEGCSLDRKRLGWWLRKKEGWTVDGIRLNRIGVDAHTKQPKYQLSLNRQEKQ